MTDPAGGPVPESSSAAHTLPGIAREVEQFVAAAGWDQAPQLFALVPTETLLAGQPQLRDQVDAAAPLTPVAQEDMPEGELDVALAGIEWPEVVAGCALVQEIVVLPPGAEEGLGGLPADSDAARRVAAEHPERREARLVAAVLREGVGACVLRLRAPDPDDPGEDADEIIENPGLAPNLLQALLATLS